MHRIDDPKAFLFFGRSGFQRATCSEKPAEDFRSVPGMQHDKAHAFKDATMNPVNDFVRDVFVTNTPPPDQHIAFRQAILTESVSWLILRRCRYLQFRHTQTEPG